MTGERAAKSFATARSLSPSRAWSSERISLVPAGNAWAPMSCSGWAWVATSQMARPGATLSATAATAAPFGGPRPVSTTSTPLVPTMRPTLGTPGVVSASGITCT